VAHIEKNAHKLLTKEPPTGSFFVSIIKTIRDSVSKAQLLVSLHFWIPETSAR